MSSRSYDYKNEAPRSGACKTVVGQSADACEALCDANAQIFRTAVRAVRDATPDGLAASLPDCLAFLSTCARTSEL